MTNHKAGNVNIDSSGGYVHGQGGDEPVETATHAPDAGPFDSADLAAYLADHLQELQELARACGCEDVALPLGEARRAALDALANSKTS